jgi:lysozyme family protein
MNLELLSDPNLILHLFDFGVNSGTGTAIKILQRLVGATPDGGIGRLTVQAIADFDGDIVEEYIKRRKLFYVTLAQDKPQFRVFLKGWLKRVDNTKFKT